MKYSSSYLRYSLTFCGDSFTVHSLSTCVRACVCVCVSISLLHRRRKIDPAEHADWTNSAKIWSRDAERAASQKTAAKKNLIRRSARCLLSIAHSERNAHCQFCCSHVSLRITDS